MAIIPQFKKINFLKVRIFLFIVVLFIYISSAPIAVPVMGKALKKYL